MEMAVTHQKPPTLKEELQRYVRYEVSRIGQAEGYESFEEFDDFTEDEPEPDWSSEYEMSDMQEEAEYTDPSAPEMDFSRSDHIEANAPNANPPEPPLTAEPSPSGEDAGSETPKGTG